MFRSNDGNIYHFSTASILATSDYRSYSIDSILWALIAMEEESLVSKAYFLRLKTALLFYSLSPEEKSNNLRLNFSVWLLIFEEKVSTFLMVKLKLMDLKYQ